MPTRNSARRREGDPSAVVLSRTALAGLLVAVFVAGVGLAVVLGAGGVVGTADAGAEPAPPTAATGDALHPCENVTQRPYGGDAPALPATIDAAHFDEGGEGVAYHDDEPERRDDSGFRPDTGVDVEAPSNGGSGDGSIGYVEPGEWVEYTVTMGPGTYTLSVSVSSHLRGRLAAFVDGQRVGNVTAQTGGAYQFETVEVGTFTVEEAGEHVIRIESLGPYLNLDRIAIRWASE